MLGNGAPSAASTVARNNADLSASILSIYLEDRVVTKWLAQL